MAWDAAPAPPSLAAGEVHVWRVGLDRPAAQLADWERALAPGERERAGRLRSRESRRRFTASRGCLRALLARYAGAAAPDLDFEYGPHGKPRLGAPHDGLSFNISHSGELLLLAVARSRAVGVDLERTQRDLSWERVARRFFAPRELEALRSLPAAERRTAFFRCWTRKEAYLKATGQGVALGLGRCAVTLMPDEAPALTWVDGGQTHDWVLADVGPGAGYVGALCAAGRDWTLQTFQLTG